MRRSTVAALAVSTLALFVASGFDWPIDGGKYRFGFGTPRGVFLRGLEFGSGDGLVRAADDGELAFVSDGPRLPGGYPLSGNSILVLAHASDVSTIYVGMESGSISSYLKNVRRGDVLGRSPEVKAGRGTTVYAFDAKERRYINPMIIMPAQADGKAPVIKSVALSADGLETGIDVSASVRQGTYDLLVDAYDTSPTGAQSAPYDIRVIIDGSERARVVYDAAWASGGVSSLFSARNLSEQSYLAMDGRIRFGPYTFASGRVIITIIVSDYAGNRREQNYSITVR